jgi:hypothetical protein
MIVMLISWDHPDSIVHFFQLRWRTLVPCIDSLLSFLEGGVCTVYFVVAMDNVYLHFSSRELPTGIEPALSLYDGDALPLDYGSR